MAQQVNHRTLAPLVLGLTLLAPVANASEGLLGYTKGAEPLPEGALEFYQTFVQRSDKGAGYYEATDFITELEYGVSNRFSASISLFGHSIDTHGLHIDGYLPQDKNITQLSGFEVSAAYAFLTPALDDIGLSTSVTLEYDTIDKHSGQDKDTLSVILGLQLQKYFLDGQMVWLGNFDMETTHANRSAITGINDQDVWPTEPEMEIALGVSTGLSYRFAPNWSMGIEAVYEEEHETEVGLERWSLFAGPSIHYGGKKFWSTLTYLPQISGGGETYPSQADTDLHLIEKTKQEIKFTIGYNF
ncbi:DUF6662 family protein [Thiomicrorhabdus sp.]|uniref:DUF6662 family protein n=1 Tax=Thiomicrorhabdus sp. TaxID=2039724 RepID=UPI0029C638F8|nr:DUF6662 family protein [Thiomicrorhabdus sp.]